MPKSQTSAEEIESNVQEQVDREASLTKENQNLKIENGDLKVQVAKLEEYKKKYVVLENEIQVKGLQSASRRARYFGFLIQGMANSGAFNPEKLALKAGSEKNLIQHAINLSGHIAKAADESL